MRDAGNMELCYFWATQLPLPYEHCVKALLVTLQELTVSRHLYSPSEWACLFRTRMSGQDFVASYPSHDHSIFHDKETLLPIILSLFCIRVCSVSWKSFTFYWVLFFIQSSESFLQGLSMRGLLLTTMNEDLGFLFEFCLGRFDTYFISGIFVQIMNFVFLSHF